ncbi:hypothetical protein Hanom_Chr11g01046111 [Helianthus anomalus]
MIYVNLAVQVIIISSTSRGSKRVRSTATSSRCGFREPEFRPKPSRLLQRLSKRLVLPYVSITHTSACILHGFLEVGSLNLRHLIFILIHRVGIRTSLPFLLYILHNTINTEVCYIGHM